MAKEVIVSAAEYVEQKRAEQAHRFERNARLYESVVSGFNDLGVSSIQIGENIIDLKEKSSKLASTRDEDYFIAEISSGKPLFIFNHNTDRIGYNGKEQLIFSNQKLSDLIDVEKALELAPTATIFAPQDNKPWSEIFSTDSYQIFITNTFELESLYKNIQSWVKTQWHDDISKNLKSQLLAQHIFQMTLIVGVRSDLSWKYAQSIQANKKRTQIEGLGSWNIASQTALKNILRELVGIEEHPTMGSQIKSTIDNLIPLLDDSMNGKTILQKANKECIKAQNNLYKNISFYNTGFQDWTGDYKSDFKMAK